jgi:hypothetical protein
MIPVVGDIKDINNLWSEYKQSGKVNPVLLASILPVIGEFKPVMKNYKSATEMFIDLVKQAESTGVKIDKNNKLFKELSDIAYKASKEQKNIQSNLSSNIQNINTKPIIKQPLIDPSVLETNAKPFDASLLKLNYHMNPKRLPSFTDDVLKEYDAFLNNSTDAYYTTYRGLGDSHVQASMGRDKLRLIYDKFIIQNNGDEKKSLSDLNSFIYSLKNKKELRDNPENVLKLMDDYDINKALDVRKTIKQEKLADDVLNDLPKNKEFSTLELIKNQVSKKKTQDKIKQIESDIRLLQESPNENKNEIQALSSQLKDLYQLQNTSGKLLKERIGTIAQQAAIGTQAAIGGGLAYTMYDPEPAKKALGWLFGLELKNGGKIKRLYKKGGKICKAGKDWVDKKPGGWSAYKAMQASKFCKDPNYAKSDKKEKGGILFKKGGKAGNQLKAWKDENWTKSDGSPCGNDKAQSNPSRCKPAAKWKTMSESEKKADNAKKKREGSKGKQFVSATEKGKVTKTYTKR